MITHRLGVQQCASIVAMVTCTVVGCATNHIDRDLDATSIRFTQDSVPLARTSEVTSFQVTVVVRNNGPTAIVFGGCGPDAQRNINGAWTTVWSPICISNQTATVMPRDSITLPITVAGFTRSNIEPQADPRMLPGNYRLRFGISYQDQRNPTSTTELEMLESPPFVVYEPLRN